MAVRFKSKSWTSRQVLALVQSINERKEILFGKFEPGRTNAIRDKAWEEVAERYV